MRRLSVLALLLTSTLAAGQDIIQVTKSRRPDAAAQKTGAESFWDQPFDSSAGSLRAPVMGNDIKQIYSKLAAIKAESERRKSETLEQYQGRLSKIDQCDLGANLRCNSTLAFYERAVMDSQYDAYSQTMAITFSLNDESLYSLFRQEPGQYVIAEIAENTVSERHTIRNGSGASTSVLRTKGETWALSIDAVDLQSIISKVNDRYYECTVRFSMPNEWVQEFDEGLLRDVGFLYVGTLESDPAYDDKDYGSAMVGWAYAKDVTRHSLKFNLGEIWIVNKSTGRIYGKQVLGAGTIGRATEAESGN